MTPDGTNNPGGIINPGDGAPLLEVRGVSKRYGEAWALHPLDLTITEGSIHGLLGKNGAGKSTLMGIIAGSITPTSGQVIFRGQDITGSSLAARRRLGIRLLPQHAEIMPNLSVAENLLTPDYNGAAWVNWRDVRARAAELLQRYDLVIPPDVPAGSLALPDQRKLGIVKTLAGNGQLAMLDEPTTALSQAERVSLFDWMRDLNAGGQTFVYISHFNNEIQAVCDEYTILRDAQRVASGAQVKQLSSAQLSELVVGSEVTEFRRDSGRVGDVVLEVDGLTSDGVGPVSLTVRAGEIVGFIGLPGSGSQETARTIAGLRPPRSGSVTVDGRTVRCRSVQSAVRGGIAYLTPDRIGEGLVGPLSVQESMHIGAWPTRHGFLDLSDMRRVFERYRDSLSLRVHRPQQPVSELSGGNQQKVLIGRLLALQPKVLILDEPTLGIDVGTKEEVHRLVDELTDHGLAVIMLAYDTDELVRVVDRAVAFADGSISGELAGDRLSVENVLDALAHKESTYTGSVK
ncbi:sugar ABC transporter ATP-binding protein [Microlunatus soli]|uniref:Monosaccharide ABC transporter ATP-binding protein, CUT2 family n=1 Tax=Microlunatus soli TaxID=630515 RepID=A0A1H1XKM8_9ACTN|nr:sugar ABC transporter ATP-binding protein [Microlunatus soli]SDT09742.1 monosaccharide ABC transporter ATP-binding protein, CUT2 family [Microlunatus soli]